MSQGVSECLMSRMILGRKIGMTQLFTEAGIRIPVTVVKVGPMVVVAKKTASSRDGYAAVKVGFEEATRQSKIVNVEGEDEELVRWRGLSKGRVGVFTNAGIEVPRRIVREFRVSEQDLDRFNVGEVLDHTMFKEGEIVDVAGTSKGRGFTGVMKRHNFSGFKASHGVHESYRGGGSIGASAYPARVFRGKKMAGHHGNSRVTVQNLKLVKILEEDGLYLIKGGIPGHNNALVEIIPAVKKHGKIG